ncbi:hypothetical protein ALNOE001_05810 [Candidatus Methanobinarius endosymbioticus]|uniref:Uncharacterized protein n=1 Tax=Candidatus Methanobinarius endosymbioticus TaxID=2006182 RepID=A0A366MDY5_9EURY|nr:hypothetical protein ALNOE001_05810 [Candidatus Methanobinarius endosymbioticus]
MYKYDEELHIYTCYMMRNIDIIAIKLLIKHVYTTKILEF